MTFLQGVFTTLLKMRIEPDFPRKRVEKYQRLYKEIFIYGTTLKNKFGSDIMLKMDIGSNSSQKVAQELKDS